MHTKVFKITVIKININILIHMYMQKLSCYK